MTTKGFLSIPFVPVVADCAGAPLDSDAALAAAPGTAVAAEVATTCAGDSDAGGTGVGPDGGFSAVADVVAVAFRPGDPEEESPLATATRSSAATKGIARNPFVVMVCVARLATI